MKRFTETTKWDKAWFRAMPLKLKLLWLYIVDKCDAAGVVELDLGLASFQIGEPVTKEDVQSLGDRVAILPDGKLLMPKFVRFQYGDLSRDCPAHKPVFKLIEAHGLQFDRVTLGYRMGTESLQDKDKEKEEEKEGESEGVYHKDSRTVLHLLNESAGRHYRETDSNLKFISARLSEPGVDLDGMRQMIARQCKKWNGTNMADYLRPETLFNKTKFDGYYAARKEPIVDEANKPTGSRRDEGTATATDEIPLPKNFGRLV